MGVAVNGFAGKEAVVMLPAIVEYARMVCERTAAYGRSAHRGRGYAGRDRLQQRYPRPPSHPTRREGAHTRFDRARSQRQCRDRRGAQAARSRVATLRSGPQKQFYFRESIFRLNRTVIFERSLMSTTLSISNPQHTSGPDFTLQEMMNRSSRGCDVCLRPTFSSASLIFEGVRLYLY